MRKASSGFNIRSALQTSGQRWRRLERAARRASRSIPKSRKSQIVRPSDQSLDAIAREKTGGKAKRNKSRGEGEGLAVERHEYWHRSVRRKAAGERAEREPRRR